MVEARFLDWRLLRAVAFVFLLVRLILLVTTRPYMDETYYWAWGQHPALSYFDHPPLIGWTQALFSFLGWNIVSLRLGVLLTLIGDLMLLALIARRVVGEAWQASFWLIATIFLSTPIFVLVTGPALPDHLLIVFSLLTVYAVVSLRETMMARYLYLAGLAIGLATLSKYTGAFLGAGLAICILAVPRLRVLLRASHLYFAALLAIAMQLPVVIWNVQHGFASFGFITAGRAPLQGAMNLSGLAGFLLGALAVLSPFLVWAMARFLFVRQEGRGYSKLVFWLSTLCFLVASLFTNILIHWNAVAYVVVLPFLAPYLGKRWLAVPQLLYGALALCIAFVNFAVLPVMALISFADQTSAWSYGWDDVAAEIATIRQTEQIDFVAATDYSLAGPLGFELRDPNVTSLSSRTEAYDFWFDGASHTGQTALIIADRWRPLGADIRAHFAEVTEAKTITPTRFGHSIDTYTIYVGRGFTP
jgi:4-amino-4-deoxy-L-arabinose transferase-like glycosyltransferase